MALFHQKSWPVITRKDRSIKRHAHVNAVLAAVFYLRCFNDAGGNLIFHVDRPSLPNIPKIDSESIEFPALITKISPQPFDLVIFPAGLPHSVTVYEGKLARWSISYDISIAASEKLG
ncbi:MULTISPECIES: putative 2OG-Fe(II) oxygenase [unclassified Prochlorococcus]|uniref:putative 2OG-Fe(II) oxygenase n=1 Tax=unclassified Prochlorococcus TaxID=2627481 RepID=UPI00055C7BD5